MFTKTDVFIEYDSADIRYKSDNSEGIYNQYRFGVKGRITSKISGTIKGGYQNRDYADSDHKYDNPVFEIDTAANFSESVKLTLKYLLSAEESIITDNAFYKMNRLDVDLNIKGISGFRFVCGGYLEKDDFPLADFYVHDRTDYVSHLYVQPGYEWEGWLSVSLKYDFLKRNSDFDENDYSRNLIIFFVSAAI